MGRVTVPPSTSTQSVPQAEVGSVPHGPSAMRVILLSAASCGSTPVLT